MEAGELKGLGVFPKYFIFTELANGGKCRFDWIFGRQGSILPRNEEEFFKGICCLKKYFKLSTVCTKTWGWSLWGS